MYALIAQAAERVLGKDIRAVLSKFKQVQGVRKSLILQAFRGMSVIGKDNEFHLSSSPWGQNGGQISAPKK
jgi:hypothetical protein